MNRLISALSERMQYVANASLVVFVLIFVIASHTTTAQTIWEPEGINLPGQWNEWQNPPVNNLALASSTQIIGGRVVKLTNGIPRWQTIFSVAETGADIVGGTYVWLFTSGPEANPWGNKWAGVSVEMNQLQDYTYNSGADNNVSITNGKWYTINWEDAGYASSRAIFMETSAEPVFITSVSTPTSVAANEPAMIEIALGTVPSAEEFLYLRYSINNWASSEIVQASINGSVAQAIIPPQAEGTTVQYYVFSSTVANIGTDYELYTIRQNDNNGANYAYTVEGVFVSFISWANLQWPGSGQIQPGQDFLVYARVYAEGITDGEGQGEGIQAWIGYSEDNTDPDSWGNWFPATYNTDAGTQDEYVFNLGSEILTEGTYYYASTFGLFDQAKVRGGFSNTGGGFWDGVNNVSGILVSSSSPTSWLVTFTVTDGTETLENVKLKGQMTNWDTISMTQDGAVWSVTLELSAGSYEWGAIEADGTEFGIWLIDGSNLIVNIDADGNISGDTSYTTYITNMDENSRNTLMIYPNPTQGWLNISGATNNSGSFKIFNLQGKLMTALPMNAFQFDVSTLPPGVFILEAVMNGKLFRQKLIKQ